MNNIGRDKLKKAVNWDVIFSEVAFKYLIKK